MILKTSTLILLLSLVYNLNLISQPIIKFQVKSTPIIDGIYNISEWSDADTLSVDLEDGRFIHVKYKMDNQAFYFVFIGPIATYSSIYAMFPEVSFDPLFNKGNAWQSDDHWFHVSYTDCNSLGAPDIYSNCVAVQPDWIGAPNFSMSFAPDTIEMKIPFAKLQLNVQTTDTIGINFMTNTTQGSWKMWPPSADKFKPETWAKAVLDHTTRINEISIIPDEPEIWVNSDNNMLTINLPEEINTNVSVSLFDLCGRRIWMKNDLSQTKNVMSTGPVKAGIYFVTVDYGQSRISRKVFIK